MDWMPQAIREGIFTIIFISGPLVVLAAVLGLSVGIVQAATQIQEQTLASAVKIIGLFLALIVFGFYMFQYLRQYTIQNLEKAFRLVPRLGVYVKPRKNFMTIKEDGATAQQGVAVPGVGEMPSAGSTAGSLVDDLNQPETRNVNVGQKADSLGAPKGQLKEEDPNVQKIENKFKSVDRSNINKPATTNTRNEAVIRPAPRPAEPTVKPKPRPRKSITGALDRIRSSIEDNQGAQ